MAKRAGDHPLTISVGSLDTNAAVGEDWLKKASSFLESHLHSAEDVRLLLSHENVAFLLNRLKSTPAPILQKIRLGIAREAKSTVTPLDLSSILSFSSPASKLTSVAIYHETTPWLLAAPSMAQVTDLTVRIRTTDDSSGELDARLPTLQNLNHLHLISCSQHVHLATCLALPNISSMESTNTITVLTSPTHNFESKITSLKLTCALDLRGDLGVLLDCLDELTLLEELLIAPRMWLLQSETNLIPSPNPPRSGLQRLHTMDLEADFQCPALAFLIVTSFRFPQLVNLAIRKGMTAAGDCNIRDIPGARQLLAKLQTIIFPKLRHLRLDFLEALPLAHFFISSPSLETLAGTDCVLPPTKFLPLLAPRRPTPDALDISCPRLQGLDLRFDDPADLDLLDLDEDDEDDGDDSNFDEACHEYYQALDQIVRTRSRFARAGLCSELALEVDGPWQAGDDLFGNGGWLGGL
ncbi:hypothetical protein SISSUDRAFT_1060540 [Sistotremastrum suecicum HHB10207 ss-3]|uniref:F-box domain-containing protein n=1 Tax=Sistotremastrum suecicum HHB10207 ss-3 TaxID=1314776 RepID=A0A166F1R2_9AGAM|nr:hypothetical protein SISSUDRAFT_1060540 [Sistotremastrum suecicum HHB10207 ss-3]